MPSAMAGRVSAVLSRPAPYPARRESLHWNNVSITNIPVIFNVLHKILSNVIVYYTYIIYIQTTGNLDFTLLWSPWGTMKLSTYFLWVVVVVVVVGQGLTV